MLDENTEKLSSKESEENIQEETGKNKGLESKDVNDIKEDDVVDQKKDVIKSEDQINKEEQEVKDEQQDKVENESPESPKEAVIIDTDAKDLPEDVEKIEDMQPVKDEGQDVEEVKLESGENESLGSEEVKAAEEVSEADESETAEKVKSKSLETNDKQGETDVKLDEEAQVDTPAVTSSVSSDKKEEHVEVPVIDYANLSLDELVEALGKLMPFDMFQIKDQFESIRKDFTKKYRVFIADKKEEFINAGGNEIDFKFFLAAKDKFNDLVRDFKKKRQKYYKDLENLQKENLGIKLKLIDDLKHLIDNAEASTMYKNFRVLQDEWRKVGQIPHSKYNDVWRTYHHHVERFYDLLHLNNDFRDLDFKHNLEEKTKLIEKAEKLAEDSDVNHSFKELQILHRMWKEDIGPVAREIREDIWNRFSEATKKIHNKRHELQEELEARYKENVHKKIAVIDKIKSIDVDDITSHKIWQTKIKHLEELRDEFFAIGRVPRSKNEEIWQLFKDATRNFNKAKNSFYKSIKKDQTSNLHKKMDLVEQAEGLKDSEDWEMVTNVYKKIQDEWKNIGHVPRRDSDKIWKKFKDACNHYFDRLHNKQDDSNKEQTEIFNKKKDLLEQFKDQLGQEDNLTLDLVNSYIKDWKELGVVPVKMRHVESKFNKALDIAYKKLNIDKDEVSFLKFKNIIDAYVAQNDVRKLDYEQLHVRRKIDEVTKEIKQLENNISFISNASEDNPLVKNVYNNIDKYKKEVDFWKRKLLYLTKLEY